jgi:hypothetical protein
MSGSLPHPASERASRVERHRRPLRDGGWPVNSRGDSIPQRWRRAARWTGAVSPSLLLRTDAGAAKPPITRHQTPGPRPTRAGLERNPRQRREASPGPGWIGGSRCTCAESGPLRRTIRTSECLARCCRRISRWLGTGARSRSRPRGRYRATGLSERPRRRRARRRGSRSRRPYRRGAGPQLGQFSITSGVLVMLTRSDPSASIMQRSSL